MNWTYIIAGVAATLTLLGLLHQLIVKRKEATIETLTEKNKWLEHQLELANQNTPDILADRLSKRISILEGELANLAKDHDKNETAITLLESELMKTKSLYLNLKESLDICPYCDGELIAKHGLDYTEEIYR